MVDGIIKQDSRGRMRTTRERRETLLAEYDRSAMTGRKFAQLAGIKYQTFANWLQKRRRLGPNWLPPWPSHDSIRWLEAVVEKVHRQGTDEVEDGHSDRARTWWRAHGDWRCQQAALAALLLRDLEAKPC